MGSPFGTVNGMCNSNMLIKKITGISFSWSGSNIDNAFGRGGSGSGSGTASMIPYDPGTIPVCDITNMPVGSFNFCGHCCLTNGDGPFGVFQLNAGDLGAGVATHYIACGSYSDSSSSPPCSHTSTLLCNVQIGWNFPTGKYTVIAAVRNIIAAQGVGFCTNGAPVAGNEWDNIDPSDLIGTHTFSATATESFPADPSNPWTNEFSCALVIS